MTRRRLSSPKTAGLIARLTRTRAIPASPQTVYDLRRQWKPHKERLAIERSEHPTAILFHRACSGMSEVELLDPVRHAGQILLHQWSAFKTNTSTNTSSTKSTDKARNGRHKAQSWSVEGRWLNILEELVTRTYLLRCQPTHGVANRKSLSNPRASGN